IIKALMTKELPEGEWVFDTALAAWLIDSSMSDPDIKFIAQKYCSLIPPETEEKSGQISIFDGPRVPDKQLSFSAACGERLVSALKEKLREQNLERLYYTAELPLCRVLADMEKTGIKVDSGAIKEFGDSMTETIDDLTKKIWFLAGEEFNINSPKQLGVILFEKLMLPFGKKTKTGWSTNADILEKLTEKHEIIPAILEYRTLTKLKSTYCDGLIKALAPDGRIHTEFQMTATATGRLSSTEPNLQNIPVRKSFGAKLRGMFVADAGKILVDADYSQIELRLLAHVSEDKGLISAFCDGKDIHTQTASQVFSIPPEEITKEQRSKAKAVNFGIIYGIGAWSLARDIDVSAAEARQYMDRYLSEYSGVKEYQEKTVKKANIDGYVETAMGRRRYFPELSSPNRNIRAFAERAAMNMPIQGFAADLMKLATGNVWERLRKELPDARLILQVHDELIAEVSEEKAEKAAKIIKEEMEKALSLSVPVLAEANLGKSWAEAH
ncbi:MAG: DNA polymerase I, partial [Oscillospiraceae bacterium]|nr:DNA polymerase I [Oscillospiraceae bacterium]